MITLCIAPVRQKEVIYYIVLSVFLSSSYNISYIFTLKSYHLQWAHVTLMLDVIYRNTVTM